MAHLTYQNNIAAKFDRLREPGAFGQASKVIDELWLYTHDALAQLPHSAAGLPGAGEQAEAVGI